MFLGRIKGRIIVGEDGHKGDEGIGVMHKLRG